MQRVLHVSQIIILSWGILQIIGMGPGSEIRARGEPEPNFTSGPIAYTKVIYSGQINLAYQRCYEDGQKQEQGS